MIERKEGLCRRCSVREAIGNGSLYCSSCLRHFDSLEERPTSIKMAHALLYVMKKRLLKHNQERLKLMREIHETEREIAAWEKTEREIAAWEKTAKALQTGGTAKK